MTIPRQRTSEFKNVYAQAARAYSDLLASPTQIEMHLGKENLIEDLAHDERFVAFINRVHAILNHDFLTPGEIANILKVDPKTVTRWAQAGRIASVQTPGGHTRIRRSDLEAITGKI